MTAPKPEQDEICDTCNIKLEQRKDDNKEAIKQRLETYHSQTEPILEFYREKTKVTRINGEQDIDNVTGDILKNIE